MKNKKVLIIAIIVVISIVVVAIITMSSGSVPGINSISRDIEYINKKGGKDNKLAYLTEPTTTYIHISDHKTIAVTIDEEFKFNDKKGYFDNEEREDDEIELRVRYDRFEAGTYGTNHNIISIGEITTVNSHEYGSVEIIKHDENWLLAKDNLGYYYVWYSVNNDWAITNSNEFSSELGAFRVYDEDFGGIWLKEEQKAIDMYEHLKSIVKVYIVETTDTSIQYPSIDNIDFSKVKFIDSKGNTADLSDYQFVRDMIAKSLETYGIYLRKPQLIEGGYGDGKLPYDGYNIGLVKVTEQKFKADADKIIEKFNRNGREYIIMEEYGDLCVYTKVKDGEYVCITKRIFDKDPAQYIQEIKDNLL